MLSPFFKAVMSAITGFHPSSIAGYVGHWDASDSTNSSKVTLNSSNYATLINQASGGLDDINEDNASSQPTVSSFGSFDGALIESGRTFDHSFDASVMGDQDYTFFIVHDFNNVGNFQWEIQDGVGNYLIEYYKDVSAYGVAVSRRTSTGTIFGDEPSTKNYNGKMIVAARWRREGGSTYMDFKVKEFGQTTVELTDTVTASEPTWANGDSDFVFNCFCSSGQAVFAEALMYNESLSDDDMGLVFDYLVNKYGA